MQAPLPFGSSTRSRPSTFAAFALAAIALVASVDCSSSSSGSATTTGGTPGTVGALCSANSPCATGLTCAESGILLGRCTADCSANLDLCATQFGSGTLCLDASQCALVCSSASECPGAGECMLLSSGASACTANPSGTADASAPPNGACDNLGGAFGDTISNGGYRCTPSANGELGTGIDQCKNGVWVSAYTCACLAGPSGAQDPSECFDITAPGAASCTYGESSCAQCDPGTGCQAQ